MALTLGEAMEQRRIQLGLRWAEVARTAGIDVETLRQIRRSSTGRPVRPLTAAGIERALEWANGSVQKVLDGQQPVVIRDNGHDSAQNPGRTIDVAQQGAIRGDAWGFRVDEQTLTDEELDLWEEVHRARLERVRSERARRKG